MTVSALQNGRQHAPSDQRAQRVKVGLIGLAAVLLLIGLASAVFNSVNRERPVNAIGGAQPDTVAAMTGNQQAAPSEGEPLAELGVAPAATVSNVNQATQAPR
jgi:hypothetical protein